MSFGRKWRVLGVLAVSGSIVSCEGAIAPLPSPIVDPDPPNEGLLLTSSLRAAEESDHDYLVAVIGQATAVDPDVLVEVTNPRTGVSEEVRASAFGTFSAAAFARAGDVFEVRQVGADGARSAAAEVRVDRYVETKNTDGAGEPTAGEGFQPATPGEFDTDAQAGGPDDAPPAQRLMVIWSYVDDVLTIDASAGFTTPGAIVFITNVNTGSINTETADDAGGIRLSIEAGVDDEILMFAQSPKNSALTSPAIHFFVPKPGQSSGTDADAHIPGN